MPHHASPAMGPRTRTLESWASSSRWWVVLLATWALVASGGWWYPVAGAAAAIPKDLTTESYIFTGQTTTTPPPPPPPRDFEVTYKQVYATFVNLTISYNATLNFTEMRIIYDDPVDQSHHTIILNIDVNGNNGLDPYSLFDPSSGRLGFKYKLAGLYRRKRYMILFTGLQNKEKLDEFRLNFLTGDNDGEDSIYNLTGIFLVLGISTIIMVVVLGCVGYEKLIHRKSEECCAFLMCKRRKKKVPKASISPEPLMVNDGRGFDDSSSTDSNHRY